MYVTIKLVGVWSYLNECSSKLGLDTNTPYRGGKMHTFTYPIFLNEWMNSLLSNCKYHHTGFEIQFCTECQMECLHVLPSLTFWNGTAQLPTLQDHQNGVPYYSKNLSWQSFFFEKGGLLSLSSVIRTAFEDKTFRNHNWLLPFRWYVLNIILLDTCASHWDRIGTHTINWEHTCPLFICAQQTESRPIPKKKRG